MIPMFDITTKYTVSDLHLNTYPTLVGSSTRYAYCAPDEVKPKDWFPRFIAVTATSYRLLDSYLLPRLSLYFVLYAPTHLRTCAPVHLRTYIR